MTPADLTPRTEHIGSLLRPEPLLGARRRFAEDEIDADELTAAENEAIEQALARQASIGIEVVGDGEFRRTDFRAGFAAAVSGLEEEIRETAWHAGTAVVPTRRWHVHGTVARERPIAVDEARFVGEHTSLPYKITLPAAGYVAERFYDPTAEDSPYASVRELGEALVSILRDEFSELIAAGVPYVQVDNPGYATFLDAAARDRVASEGRDPDQAFQDMLDADVALLQTIRDQGAIVGLHVCRGNNAGQWLHQGSYEPIAEQLFTTLPVDRLLLEFDDERSGNLDVLRHIPTNTTAVLGLISTKTPHLEDPETLLRRLDHATTYLDADQLAISPQCGFATHAEGANPLTPDDQYRKLQTTVQVAQRFWG